MIKNWLLWCTNCLWRVRSLLHEETYTDKESSSTAASTASCDPTRRAPWSRYNCTVSRWGSGSFCTALITALRTSWLVKWGSLCLQKQNVTWRVTCEMTMTDYLINCIQSHTCICAGTYSSCRRLRSHDTLVTASPEDTRKALHGFSWQMFPGLILLKYTCTKRLLSGINNGSKPSAVCIILKLTASSH